MHRALGKAHASETMRRQWRRIWWTLFVHDVSNPGIRDLQPLVTVAPRSWRGLFMGVSSDTLTGGNLWGDPMIGRWPPWGGIL
jgi:hypothetical protein